MLAQYPQRRGDIDHLGCREQAAQADHLDGQPRRLQRLGQQRDLRAAAHQHRGGARADGQRVPFGAHPLGQPAGFVLDRLDARHRDRSPAGALGGPQRDRQVVQPAQRLRDCIRGVEDHPVATEARRQWVDGGVGAVGTPERLGEATDVARAGAPPAVDGLERIADRRDGVAVAEQAVQHRDLGVAGVLVLVEEHGGETRPLELTDLADLGQACGDAHLVAEVDGRARRLGRREVAHQRQ